MTPDSFKPTSLGLRMMLAAAAMQRVNWHYSTVEPAAVSEKLETALTGVYKTAENAGWAIIDAVQRNPNDHLGDLAVLLRCRHDPAGGCLDPAMHDPSMEDVALLYLLNTLLALGGVNERNCDQRLLFEAAKTSGVKPAYLRVRR